MENQEKNNNQKVPSKDKEQNKPTHEQATDPKEQVEGSDTDYPADESPYADLNGSKPPKDE